MPSAHAKSNLSYVCGSAETACPRKARTAGEVWANPFSVGWRDNLEQVFGATTSVAGMLLPRLHKPPGNGMDFPCNPDAVPLADFRHNV